MKQTITISQVASPLDSEAFSLVFQPNSENCSPAELTVPHLRTDVFTPHEQCTETSEMHSQQKSPSVQCKRCVTENVTEQAVERFVSVRWFRTRAQSARGASLLSDAPLVQVKEVDVYRPRNYCPRCSIRTSMWWLSPFPPKGWPDLLFANTQAPAPVRGKMSRADSLGCHGKS